MSEQMQDSTAQPTSTAQARQRWRQAEMEEAERRSISGGLRGLAVWTAVGAPIVFASHHLFDSFRRQTYAFKSFIIVAFATTGFAVGAENALQRYERQQRSFDNLIRRRAIRDLGRLGLHPSESEIARWQEELIQQELAQRKRA